MVCDRGMYCPDYKERCGRCRNIIDLYITVKIYYDDELNLQFVIEESMVPNATTPVDIAVMQTCVPISTELV